MKRVHEPEFGALALVWYNNRDLDHYRERGMLPLHCDGGWVPRKPHTWFQYDPWGYGIHSKLYAKWREYPRRKDLLNVWRDKYRAKYGTWIPGDREVAVMQGQWDNMHAFVRQVEARATAPVDFHLHPLEVSLRPEILNGHNRLVATPTLPALMKARRIHVMNSSCGFEAATAGVPINRFEFYGAGLQQCLQDGGDDFLEVVFFVQQHVHATIQELEPCWEFHFG